LLLPIQNNSPFSKIIPNNDYLFFLCNSEGFSQLEILNNFQKFQELEMITLKKTTLRVVVKNSNTKLEFWGNSQKKKTKRIHPPTRSAVLYHRI
jgi:hypothetical protein